MVVITLSVLIFLMLIAAAAALWFALIKSSHAIRKELSEITNRVNTHLEQTARLSQQTGEGTVKAISEVYRRLGSLEESSSRIYEIGKEIGKLQDVLRAPKARGGFGELMLADLLKQMIPTSHFQLQYQFRNGVRVDAAIFVGDHLVSVDAKFPLENFQRLLERVEPEERKKARREFERDVRRHIDAIAQRYILPEEGTFDFALMYIPAENVYYEVISWDSEAGDNDLSRYALDRHVIPVSPNCFYAYLHVILIGLRGLRVDEAAREIAESLAKMEGDFQRILDDFEKLGTHLNNAKGSYDRTQRRMDQFEGKLAVVDQVKAIASEKESVKAADGVKKLDALMTSDRKESGRTEWQAPAIGIFILLGLWAMSLAADVAWGEKTEVAIHKVNGRTKAVVTIRDVKFDEAVDGRGAVQETLTAVEDGALEVMGTSSEFVGKGADQAVEKVQNVGDSAFSWLFKLLDFKRESEPNQRAAMPAD